MAKMMKVEEKREVFHKIFLMVNKKLGMWVLNSLQKEEGLACCSGHFVVLWIILGIITFGILLGVVLMFTVA